MHRSAPFAGNRADGAMQGFLKPRAVRNAPQIRSTFRPLFRNNDRLLKSIGVGGFHVPQLTGRPCRGQLRTVGL